MIRYSDKVKIKSRVKLRADLVLALYNGDQENAIRLAKRYDARGEELDRMIESVTDGDLNQVIPEISPKKFARTLCREFGMDGISLYKEIINYLDRFYPGMDSIVSKFEKF